MNYYSFFGNWKNLLWLNAPEAKEDELWRFSHIYKSDQGVHRLVLVDVKDSNRRLAVVLEPQGDMQYD